MSLSDRDIAELGALSSAVVDGSATDDQMARLSYQLSASEDARRYYVRYLGLSASLYDYADPLPIAATSPSSARQAASPAVRRLKKLWWAWPVIGLAAAAAIVTVVLLPGLRGREDASLTAELETDRIAAQITGVSDCRWGGDKATLEAGDSLRAGQHLELASGIAEVTFDSGAQITLEGPAALSIDSSWEATLKHGKMTVDVPQEAIGFRAASSTVDVVDLGTEFCMLVDKEGTTEVGVLQGSVEATPRGAPGREEPPLILRQRRARRFNRTGSEEIENAASVLDRFVKPAKLERARKPVNIIRWPLDASGSPLGRAEIRGQPTSQSDMVFESAATGQQRIYDIGHTAGAAQFDGQLVAHALIPGLGERAPHTVAFWVKISPDASLTSGGPIVAWTAMGANENGVQSVQITWNTDPTQGPLGAVRTEIGRVATVGTTNLRDGAWHFVAVALVPRSRWQARQYVDGRLDETASKVAKKRRQEPTAVAQDDVIWLAGLPGSVRRGERFQGELKELAIADRVLAPPEIKRLMDQTRP